MGYRLCPVIQASVLLFLDQTQLLLWYEHVTPCPLAIAIRCICFYPSFQYFSIANLTHTFSPSSVVL